MIIRRHILGVLYNFIVILAYVLYSEITANM